MCSSLDVAKMICKQLFMTQSVGCLFKHEIEAAMSFQKIECFFFTLFFSFFFAQLKPEQQQKNKQTNKKNGR